MERKFRFELEDEVIAKNGLKGFVSMVAYDKGGNIYFIKGEIHSDWFYETELKYKPFKVNVQEETTDEN